MQLLHEGHSQIADMSPGIQVVLNQPQVLQEPVLQGTSDVDACGATIYGSVIRDGGTFRMWYQAWPRGCDFSNSHFVGCVESDDGITWRRPNYKLVEFAGSDQNHLTDLPFHSPSILIDPDAVPSARYRAFGHIWAGRVDLQPYHKANQVGYYTAHSSDGLHWILDSPEPMWPWWGDVITSAWDSHSRCARIAMKHTRWMRGLQRRSFDTAEWAGGVVTDTAAALVPDEYDDIAANRRGFWSGDYYGVGLMPTPGCTIGFLWNFRHIPQINPKAAVFGQVDVTIVVQSERGGRWQHVYGRPDWFSANDAPEWARGSVYTAASPMDMGDETWLYFSGSCDRHGWFGVSKNARETMHKLAGSGGFAKIGLLKWKRDRIIGFKALLNETVSLRPPAITESMNRLVVNVVTGMGGSVRARLVSTKSKEREALPGFDFDDCIPVSGDHLHAEIRWKNQSTLPPTTGNQPYAIELEITNGTLYAFDFLKPG